MIAVNPKLIDVSAYIPPWEGLDRSAYLRLDLNESTRAIPPAAAERLVRQIRDVGVHAYPDYAGFTAALAGYCGVPADRLLVTNGSDQAIDLVLRTVLEEGRSMVVARPEFAIFSHVADILGAKVAGVPYGPEFRYPYETFDQAITAETGIIVVINPNNPTGTPVDAGHIATLLRAHPTIPVLVDEAYFEYTGDTAAALLGEHDNLIILRTFSKAFSMAGLRLGYVIADPAFIRELRKVRGPFDVNCLALVAAAAQLEDLAPMRAHVEEVMTRAKPYAARALRALGVGVHEGAANFVLASPPDGDAMVAHLKSRGILVRPLRGPRLDGLIRMGIGTEAEMARVADALAAFFPGK